jgi:hypothetical protein
MAKLSDLVRCTSDVTGTAEPTVREISRRLREGGLIHTGRGGRYGGAHMTRRDAASLLTGLLIAKSSPIAFADLASVSKQHLNLTAHDAHGKQMILARWSREAKLPGLCKLEVGHTFGDAFEALLGSFASGEFERTMPEWGAVNLDVAIHSPRPFRTRPDQEAIIELDSDAHGDVRMFYLRHRHGDLGDAAAPRKWRDISTEPQSDLLVAASISLPTLKSIGLLLKDPGGHYG